MSKIVMIGVGSVSFGAGTIGDLLYFKDKLASATISLVDVNPDVLDLMTTLANKMNDRAGKPFTIESDTDRRKVLKGADFVVTSPAIKREELWEKDWNIINGAGIKMTYGENGGPGSLSHTLRNVPMLLDICKDIESLAPSAWVINFTNPEARICMALDRYTKLKFVGLCHQIHAGYELISKALGIPVEDIDVKAYGLNHFTWMKDIRRISTHEDLYPALRKAVLRDDKLPDEPLTRKMFEITGLFPCPGDHHLAEFLSFGWEFQGLHGRDFKRTVSEKEENLEWLKGVADGSRKIEEKINGLSGERVVHMILGILYNQNSFEISMDVRNNGAISNLPEDAIVEVPGIISSMGIAPLRMGALPDVIADFALKQIRVQELSVKAAVTDDRMTALHAMLLDPVVDSAMVSEKVLNEILDTHLGYVSPNFFR